jgi:predicted transcriptional regulator
MAELRLQQTPEQRGGTARQAAGGVVSAEEAGLGRQQANRPMGIQAPQGIGGVAQRGDQIIADANLAAAKLRGEGEMAVAQAKGNLYNTVINTVSNTANAYFDMQKRQEAERKRAEEEERARQRAVEDFKLKQGELRSKVELGEEWERIQAEASEKGQGTDWMREQYAERSQRIINKHLGEDKFVDQEFIKPRAELLREVLTADGTQRVSKETKTIDVQNVKAGWSMTLQETERYIGQAKTMEEFNERKKAYAEIATHPTFQSVFNPIEQATLLNAGIGRVEKQFAQSYAMRIDEGMINARSSRDASAIGNQMLGEYENVLANMTTLTPVEQEQLRNNAARVVKATTKQLETEERQRAAEIRVQQNAARESVKDGFIVAIERGKLGLGEMPTLQDIEKQRGVMGEDKYTQVLRAWGTANEEKIKTNATLHSAQTKISQGLAVTDTREINLYYKATVQSAQQVPESMRMDFVHKQMSSLASLPSDYKNELSAAAYSNDPKAVAFAAQQMKNLQSHSPRLYAELPSELRSIHEAINNQQKPVETVIKMRDTMAAQSEGQKDVRKDAWKKDSKDFDWANDLRNSDGLPTTERGWFAGAPKHVEDKALGDYQTAVKSYYDMGHDFATARRLAQQDMYRKIGRTRVDGRDEVRYNAPEVLIGASAPDIVESRNNAVLRDTGINLGVAVPVEKGANAAQPGVIRRAGDSGSGPSAMSEAYESLQKGTHAAPKVKTHTQFVTFKDGKPVFMIFTIGEDGVQRLIKDKNGKPYYWSYDENDTSRVMRTREENARFEAEANARKAATPVQAKPTAQQQRENAQLLADPTAPIMFSKPR